eukprot:scaffold175740_cov23-Tisochrysis_lutea.AAC.1
MCEDGTRYKQVQTSGGHLLSTQSGQGLTLSLPLALSLPVIAFGTVIAFVIAFGTVIAFDTVIVAPVHCCAKGAIGFPGMRAVCAYARACTIMHA